MRKHKCPLNEKCLTNNVLYKASITPNEEKPKMKIYYGVSKTAFKLRCVNHKKTSNNIKYQTDTELSNECWNIISDYWNIILKAFDTINHSLLLAKLNAYSFSRTSLKLMQNYLCNRQQIISINSSFSNWTEVITGAPQGFILGPFLFNVF